MTVGTDLLEIVDEAARWARVRARAFRRNRRVWTARRAPVVRIADARVGQLVKLSGRVELAGPAIRAPFTCTPCAFWEAKLNDADEDDLTERDVWEQAVATQQFFHETTTTPFYVVDDTGHVRVEPAAAIVRLSLRNVSQHPHVNDGNAELMTFLAARGIRSASFMGVENVFLEACLVPLARVSVFGMLSDAPSVEQDGYRDRTARMLRLSSTEGVPLVLFGDGTG